MPIIYLDGISLSNASSHVDLNRSDGFPNVKIIFYNQDVGAAAASLKAGSKVILGFWDVGDDFLHFIDYGKKDLFGAAVEWMDHALPYVQQLKDLGVTDEQLQDLYLVGFNEPVLDEEQTVLLVQFEVYRMQIAEAHGLHCAIFSYAVGNPDYSFYPLLDPALEQCHIGCHLFTGHSYFGPNPGQYYGKNQTLIYITDLLIERSNGNTTILKGDLLRIRDEYQAKIDQDAREGKPPWPPNIEVRDGLNLAMVDLDKAVVTGTYAEWVVKYQMDLFPRYYAFGNHLLDRCRQLWLYVSKKGWTNFRYADTEAGADFVGSEQRVTDWAGGNERGYKDWLASGIWRRKIHDAARAFLRFLLTDPTLTDAAKWYIDQNSQGDLSDQWIYMACLIWYDWQTRKDFWYWGFMVFTDGSFGWGNFDISGEFHDILYEYIQRMTPGYPYDGPAYGVEGPEQPTDPVPEEPPVVEPGPSTTLLGLHCRADGPMQESDWEVFRLGKFEALKLTTSSRPEDVDRARAINPDVTILLRLFADFNNRVVTPAEFATWMTGDVKPFYDRGVRDLEVHNEPNLVTEGYGRSWGDGKGFNDWFIAVVELLKPVFPEANFIFPGLSPGPVIEGVRPQEQFSFLAQCDPAISLAKKVACHNYWQNESEMWSVEGGLGYQRFLTRFPGKPILITEFSNVSRTETKAQKADQYVTYRAALGDVEAAYIFVSSASNPDFFYETLRHEDGTITVIPQALGGVVVVGSYSMIDSFNTVNLDSVGSLIRLKENQTNREEEKTMEFLKKVWTGIKEGAVATWKFLTSAPIIGPILRLAMSRKGVIAGLLVAFVRMHVPEIEGWVTMFGFQLDAVAVQIVAYLIISVATSLGIAIEDAAAKNSGTFKY